MKEGMGIKMKDIMKEPEFNLRVARVRDELCFAYI